MKDEMEVYEITIQREYTPGDRQPRDEG